MTRAGVVLLVLMLGVPSAGLGQQVGAPPGEPSPEPAFVTPSAPGPDGRPCWPTAAAPVVVRQDDGTQHRGTLLCLGRTHYVLADPLPTERGLAGVRDIVKPADPVWDGALKGAAFGLIMLAVCFDDCPGAYVLRAMATYAAIGAAFDAVDSHRAVLYRREKRMAPMLRMRVGF